MHYLSDYIHKLLELKGKFWYTILLERGITDVLLSNFTPLFTDLIHTEQQKSIIENEEKKKAYSLSVID